jgi:uncharacterized protein involved in oxidation of intracellular sulfur
MKYLLILNDPPYGTERSYNGLRLASSLAKRPDSEVKVFLMADSAACGKAGQKTPQGYYNIERMLKSLVNSKVSIGVCGTCIDARGITEAELADGVHRGSLEELTDWCVWADKV